MKSTGNDGFERALQRACDEAPLSEVDLVSLLSAKGLQREQLYAAARHKRQQYFGNRLFAYGFVYFSTHCRNNCTFCFYRKSNHDALRYRKSKEEILQISERFLESDVHLLDLTMGEDPMYVFSDAGFRLLMEIAAEVRDRTKLPQMISPGVLDENSANQASNEGIEFYACYQETHNRQLYAGLRAGQDYDERWNAKIYASQKGMLVEEGILVGVGETLPDIAHSIDRMRALNAAQVRVMSFVPQKGAPLKRQVEEGLYERELNTLATMRLAMPGRFIPASLDIAGKAGLKERLDAGANIVTSIIVPDSGFAGVSNATLDVDNGSRSLPGIQDTVAECGLQMGSKQEFAETLQKLREECKQHEDSNFGREAAGS